MSEYNKALHDAVDDAMTELRKAGFSHMELEADWDFIDDLSFGERGVEGHIDNENFTIVPAEQYVRQIHIRLGFPRPIVRTDVPFEEEQE